MTGNKSERRGRKITMYKQSKLHEVMLEHGYSSASKLYSVITDKHPLDNPLTYHKLLSSIRGERDLRANEVTIISDILEIDPSILLQPPKNK